jgi:hypothetical protein
LTEIRVPYTGSAIINKTIALNSITRPLMGVIHEHSTFSKAPKTMRPLGIVLAVLGMTLGFMGGYVLTKYLESWIQLSGMLPRFGTNKLACQPFT